ncbi:efflux transporter outer membrane subunit [Acidovorax sp. SUPP2522]|uniref:efflux transporter outer membrane subunit n=1 Tax=unclassified Acidovorax TaxID=2684926 RepID=UPI00234A4F17|nr:MULTISPECIES: efflux transporter outer membrane subunit [unclassified Acidovorax]WCM96630.1 efflux transporter outer membrane subunit [Acidovorax sp. GBBC 1281]GKT19270.1 efflux transporter outer membrane subunit [Acidovorax sp. SUPP2522]
MNLHDTRYRLRRTALAALAGSLLLAACTTVPADPAPVVALPAHWSGTQEAAPASSAADWWGFFGSTQLDALVAQGLDQGLSVQIALARLEQARGMAQISGAARYPTVTAGLNASGGSSSSSPKQSLSITGTMDLDIWGLHAAKADSAGSVAQASELDVETARQLLAANIALNYLQLLALDERIDLSRRIASDAQQLLSLVEKQASLGAASALDVAQQRNTLQTFLAATPQLVLQRDTLRGQLAVLVNATPQEFTVRAEPFLDIAVPQIQAIAPARAVAGRPEVLAAEARLKAARFDVAAARAAFLPSVSITAQAGALLNPTQALWSLAGALLQPLFNGGSLDGQLRVDRAHAEELLASYRQSILQVLQEAQGQLIAVQRLQETETLDKAAVESAQEALRLSRIRYDRGAYDLLAVIVNERTLYQAQDTLLQARLQRLQATVGLYRAFGGQSAQPAPAQISSK